MGTGRVRLSWPHFLEGELFIHRISTEYLLWANHCSWCWKCISDEEANFSALWELNMSNFGCLTVSGTPPGPLALTVELKKSWRQWRLDSKTYL